MSRSVPSGNRQRGGALVEKRTAWLFVFGQFTLLALIVLLPDAQQWTVSRGLARASDIASWVAISLMVLAATALGRGLTAAPLPNAHAQLRTGGFYHFVRHPIYSGLLLFSIARSLSAGNTWTALACVLLVALINVKARWEERRLVERFPDYVDYAVRTPRFLPRLATMGNP